MADKINKNPWLGLSSYKYEDASRFYGRDKELQDLAEIIRQNSFTTIYGVSGAGKTSIINAGLFPVLDKENYLPIYIRLNHGEGRLGYDEQIITAVEDALARVCAESELMVEANIESELDKLWLYFHSHRFWTSDNHKLIPILFIDQFEEIFTKNEDVNDVWSFFNVIDSLQYNMPTDRLLAKIQETDQCVAFGEEMNFRVVFSMREDFLPRLEDYCFDIPAMRRNRVGLKPLNGLQALEVISKPRPDLVSREVALLIISKVVGMEIKDNHRKLESIYVETSILSLFCSELYNYLSTSDASQKITRSLVDTYGENILELYYNRNMQLLPEKTYIYLEGQLLTHSGFRNSVAFEDLIVNGVSSEQLEVLEENRIIRIEDVYHVRRVEFTHDVLCKIAKEHREKRKEKVTAKKTYIEKWHLGIEFLIFSILSVYIIFDAYYKSQDYVFSSIIRGMPYLIISVIFVFQSKLPLMHRSSIHQFVGLLLLSALLYFTRQVILTKQAIFRWIVIGPFVIYPLTIIKIIIGCYITTFFLKIKRLQNIFFAFSATLLFVDNIVTNRYSLCVLFAGISFFVLMPYRYVRDRNVLITSLMTGVSALFICMISNTNWYLSRFSLLALYPLIYVCYFKRKKLYSIKESLYYCFSLQIYKERPFFRSCINFYLCIIAISSTLVAGLSLSDIYSYVNILIVSPFLFSLLKKLFKIDLRKPIKTALGLNSKYFEIVLICVILSVFTVLQYIPYGAIGQIVLLLFVLFLQFKYYEYNGSNVPIKKILSVCLLWIIPFLIIPYFSMGYNPFSLIQYGRILNGKIYSRPYTRFLTIYDIEGHRGLRDRNSLIIPAEFKGIRLKTFDAAYYGDKFPLNTEAEIGIYKNRRLPEISFYVEDNDGRKQIWRCSEHLNMENICTSFILSTYDKMLENGNTSYIDYLIKYLPEEKGTIQSACKTLFKHIMERQYPEYTLQGFFENVKYLEYLPHEYINEIFNQKMPIIINRLDNNYNKNRLAIECAFYQLLCNDIVGAKKKLAELVNAQDEQTRISANRVMCDLFLLSGDYESARQIISLYQHKDEAFFANQNKNFYIDNYNFEGKINFIDAIRNDIVKFRSQNLIPEKNSEGLSEIEDIIKSRSSFPDYDFSILPFDDFLKYEKNNKKYKLYVKCHNKSLYNDEIDYKYMFVMLGDSVVTPNFVRFSSSKDVDADIITIILADNYIRRFFDLSECRLLDGEYDKAWRFSEGLAFVVLNRELQIIDRSGKIVSKKAIPYNFHKYNNKELMYGTTGLYRYNNEPDHIFQNGTCNIEGKNGKYGLIDHEGNWVVKPIYNDISQNIGEGFRCVSNDSGCGILDVNGKLITEMNHSVKLPYYYYTYGEYITTNYAFDDVEFNNEDVELNRKLFIDYIKSLSNHPNKTN